MTQKQPINEYDLTKKMLNTIREIQASVDSNKFVLLREQVTNDKETVIRKGDGIPPPPIDNDNMDYESGEEQEDIAVINDVEVVIHSEDPEDLELKDDEKNNISQLIDEFRTEVSEIVEFDKLHIYEDNAKLEGKISDVNLGFTLSTGNDTGIYLSNTSMMKIDEDTMDMINKLKTFHPKFINTINNLLVHRKST
jgi:sporulation protein YlmC with PRC-barrel domain